MDEMHPENPERNPVVKMVDGRPMADSRDVAATFQRQHKNVLQAYQNLNCSADFKRLNFQPFKNKDLTGESLSHVLMTKNGFAFLVLGFTGAEAGVFKEGYIERFDAMERELLSGRAAVDPAALLNDPTALRALLLENVEKRLSLEARVEADKPKTSFYDRYIDADGLYGLQNAARAMGCHPNRFIRWLKEKFMFYQGTALVPRVQYIQMGLFEVKSEIVDDKARPRSYITPRGLEYFSKRVPDSIKTNRAA